MLLQQGYLSNFRSEFDLLDHLFYLLNGSGEHRHVECPSWLGSKR